MNEKLEGIILKKYNFKVEFFVNGKFQTLLLKNLFGSDEDGTRYLLGIGNVNIETELNELIKKRVHNRIVTKTFMINFLKSFLSDLEYELMCNFEEIVLQNSVEYTKRLIETIKKNKDEKINYILEIEKV